MAHLLGRTRAVAGLNHGLSRVEAVAQVFLNEDPLARGQTFALRVSGDSMIEDAILDGDMVVVQACEKVDDGDAAVVLLPDGTATLKRVYTEANGVRLQPSNRNMQPVHVPEVRIRGRVVGLVREFLK